MTRLALIGDSHAKIVFKTLVPLLETKKFKPVFVRAENGWSLKKHISKGSLEQIRKAKPQVILASLGGNNHDLKIGSYKRTVNDLIKLAKSIGAKIVWVGPTTSRVDKAPNTERRHAWTENFLSKYIPQHGTYISMREFTKTGQGKDGVHYPFRFYKQWAQYVAERVDIPSSFILPLIGVSALGLATIIGLAVRNRFGSTNKKFVYTGVSCPIATAELVEWSIGESNYPLPTEEIQWSDFISNVFVPGFSPTGIHAPPNLGEYIPMQSFATEIPKPGRLYDFETINVSKHISDPTRTPEYHESFYRSVLPSGQVVYVWQFGGVEHWFSQSGEMDVEGESKMIEKINDAVDDLEEQRYQHSQQTGKDEIPTSLQDIQNIIKQVKQ